MAHNPSIASCQCRLIYASLSQGDTGAATSGMGSPPVHIGVWESQDSLPAYFDQNARRRSARRHVHLASEWPRIHGGQWRHAVSHT